MQPRWLHEKVRIRTKIAARMKAISVTASINTCISSHGRKHIESTKLEEENKAQTHCAVVMSRTT
jgi:hypothetical protein